MTGHHDQIHAVLLLPLSNLSDAKPNCLLTAADIEEANGSQAYGGHHPLSSRSPKASLRFQSGAWALQQRRKAKEMKSKNMPTSKSSVLLSLRIEELDASHSD